MSNSPPFWIQPFIIFLFLIQAQFNIIEWGPDPTLYNSFNYPTLDSKYPNDIQILKRECYTTGYDNQRKNPAWVSYKLKDVKHKKPQKRPSHFKTDSETKARVNQRSYKGSGYDKGHLAPNFAIATHCDRAAQLETFLMSNIVPQKPALNRGVWRKLELDTAKRSDEVWVITGPIYSEPIKYLGRDKIQIPHSFFKIIIGKQSTQAFIIPQTVARKTNYKDFSVTIDEIERRTKLKFP